MNPEYFTRAGNQNPQILMTVKRNGSAVNLAETGVSTVSVEIKRFDTGAITNTGHTSATIESATEGEISYQPELVDFPVEGFYIANITLTYSDNRIERLYEQLVILAKAV